MSVGFSALSEPRLPVAGSWRVNLSLFLQQLKHAREKGLLAVSRRWMHALGGRLGRPATSRRSAVHSQSLRTEPLEIRQVLSAISPLTGVTESVEVIAAAVDEEDSEFHFGIETGSESDDSFGTDFGIIIGGGADDDDVLRFMPEKAAMQGMLDGDRAEVLPQFEDPVQPSRGQSGGWSYRSPFGNDATQVPENRTEATTAGAVLDEVFANTVVLFNDFVSPAHQGSIISDVDPVLVIAAAVPENTYPLEQVQKDFPTDVPNHRPQLPVNSAVPGYSFSARVDKSRGHDQTLLKSELVSPWVYQPSVGSETGSPVSASPDQRPGEYRRPWKRLAQRDFWSVWRETGPSEYVWKFHVHDDRAATAFRVIPKAVPVFTENTASRDGQAGQRQPSSFASQVQVQSKKLRENQRQSLTPDPLQLIAIDDSEVPVLPSGSSIPREMKYVANPRGPPPSLHLAVVPSVETEAPVSLLERLRYSIAPRGPSLVAAEMQSPECQSFSGPRISSEESRLYVAC